MAFLEPGELVLTEERVVLSSKSVGFFDDDTATARMVFSKENETMLVLTRSHSSMYVISLVLTSRGVWWLNMDCGVATKILRTFGRP